MHRTALKVSSETTLGAAQLLHGAKGSAYAYYIYSAITALDTNLFLIQFKMTWIHISLAMFHLGRFTHLAKPPEGAISQTGKKTVVHILFLLWLQVVKKVLVFLSF